jgi:hypothetical protein
MHKLGRNPTILPLLLDAIDPARYVVITEAWCVAGGAVPPTLKPG